MVVPTSHNKKNQIYEEYKVQIASAAAALFVVFLLLSFQGQTPIQEDSKLLRVETTTTRARKDVPLFEFPPSVKDVVINVGSNLDPIMPTKEMGPCARAIAIEPLAGLKIPAHRQLSVIHAAVSDEPGVMSMKMMNVNGLSSSLAKVSDPTTTWSNNKKRGDGTLVLVPVITLSSLLKAIPDTARVAVIKTDMQGYDFTAIKEAGSVLKERVTHIYTEVWREDHHPYQAENDLCRDWMPFMTNLGYTFFMFKKDVSDKKIMQGLMERLCEKQLKENPQRPPMNEKTGLKEGNAYWVRNDAVGQPFPDVKVVQNFKPGFTEEDYASCD